MNSKSLHIAEKDWKQMKKENIRLEIMQQRIKHNMSQQELAKDLNVSQKIISLWENGESYPRKTNCIKLANLFNLPIDHFFVEDEEGNDTPADSEVKKSAVTQPPEITAAFQTLIQHYGDVETAATHLKGFEMQK
jgi:DNA-binding XRE family transcriptional regulator